MAFDIDTNNITVNSRYLGTAESSCTDTAVCGQHYSVNAISFGLIGLVNDKLFMTCYSITNGT